MWLPTRLPADDPIYVAIADALARDIEAGSLSDGDRLPTHRDLARELGINVMTVTRAYAEAARRGLVEGTVGRGTFVRHHRRQIADIPPIQHSGDGLIDFQINLPVGDGDLLSTGELLRDAGCLLDQQYCVAGLDKHRAAGAEWIAASGVDASAERTLVCGGAQHALTVAISALTGPNDTLLCEQLSYPGIKSLAGLLNLKLHGLEMDDEGLLPDALEPACRQGPGRVLYCMPTLHNPTGVTMPATRREAIATIARKYGVSIIEDDTCGRFAPDAPEPLACHAPELTFFVTSLSKTLTAAVRIGYLLAPTDGVAGVSVDRLIANIQATAWMSAPMMAELAAHWIRSGDAERLVAWKRSETARRRKIFDQRATDLVSSSAPESPHVWAQLPAPWRAEDFAAQARMLGVAIGGAEAFVVGRGGTPHATRICLGTAADTDEVERGVSILADLARGQPGTAPSLV
jgi:DNA-binding transcriptional MocR family regulator